MTKQCNYQPAKDVKELPGRLRARMGRPIRFAGTRAYIESPDITALWPPVSATLRDLSRKK